METKFSFDDWESPMGTYDHVVIRGTDVQYLDIEMNQVSYLQITTANYKGINLNQAFLRSDQLSVMISPPCL